MKKHYHVAAAISLLLCFCNIARSQTAAPNPQEILRKMVARYSSVSSYQDSGNVRVLSTPPSMISNLETPNFQNVSHQDEPLVCFKTFYLRPQMFRFEWNSSSLGILRAATIWSDGEHPYRWVPTRASKKDEFLLQKGTALRVFINEATGPSNGAIFFVPSLLIREVSHVSFADMLNTMSGLSIIREEKFDGEICHVIKGKIDAIPWMLWIGKDSHLLRKTRTLYTRGSFHEMVEKGLNETLMAEEIHRDIKVNEKISIEVFKFRPQLQAHDVDLTQ